jgi:hypothetical protein
VEPSGSETQPDRVARVCRYLIAPIVVECTDIIPMDGEDVNMELPLKLSQIVNGIVMFTT